MNLYLDDDSADRRLVTELRRAGHTVAVPADAGLAGATDARHLIHALLNELTLLTRNHDDFLDLHEVVEASQGRHFGMLVVRYDNDPNRDMTPRGIVTAIGKLEAAGVDVANQVHILNQWRGLPPVPHIRDGLHPHRVVDAALLDITVSAADSPTQASRRSHCSR